MPMIIFSIVVPEVDLLSLSPLPIVSDTFGNVLIGVSLTLSPSPIHNQQA